jgi:uncharacterized membrane protein (DUF373 family)
VEVSLVSALREVILKGVLEIPSVQLLEICAFLGILGVLLLLRVWISQHFSEQQIAEEGKADLKESKQYPY